MDRHLYAALYDSIVALDFVKFRASFEPLVPASLRHIPFKMYVDCGVKMDLVLANELVTIGDLLQLFGIRDGDLMLHGMLLPRQTSLLQLVRSGYTYPDGFLHLVVSRRQ